MSAETCPTPPPLKRLCGICPISAIPSRCARPRAPPTKSSGSLFAGDPAADTTFVLAHAGLITAPIMFAGSTAANGVTTAGNIQAALRALAEPE